MEPVKRPAVVKMETDDYSCLTQQLPLPNRETDEYPCTGIPHLSSPDRETGEYSLVTQQHPSLLDRETDEYSCVTHHYPSSLDTGPFTTEPPSIPVNQKLLPDVNVKAEHFLQNDTAHADLCVTVSRCNAFIM